HVADNGLNRVHRELARAQERAAQHLESRGARVERVVIPALKRSVLIWSSMLSAAGGEEFAEVLFGGARRPILPELARYVLGRSPHTFPALALAALEQIPKMLPSDTAKALAEGEALKREL